ncbi:DUF3179 domain-containing protein [Planctomycetales bacterium ZRK34]|nr:DUF3179 domain-containing protein [Planctomycetales bacterium ZRK34]
MADTSSHDLTFRSAPAPRRRGFWLMFALIFGICLLAAVYQIYYIASRRAVMIGDGKTVESYQYDLSNFALPRGPLVAGGLVKDGMPVPTNPRLVDESSVATFKHPGPRITTNTIINKFNDDVTKVFSRPVVGSDEIIGVTLNGKHRAYPLRFMRWCEIVNDTLGGVPIAVTYSPLCDAVVVFDRRVNGKTLEFGYSGLLYNSNLVLYDRQPDAADESLWVQLKFEAVSGKAVGQKLTVLPIEMMQWKQWAQAHEDTTVFIGDYTDRDRYKRDPYRDYLEKRELEFPVEPLPSAGGEIELFDRVWAVRRGDTWATYPAQAVMVTGGRIEWPTPPALQQLAEALEPGHAAEVTGVVRSLWFAWHAMHPDAAMVKTGPAR